jgi:F0F1-type ATP synthase assembly protein I
MSENDGPDKEEQENWDRQSYKWMGVGIEFVLVIGFFCWLGSLLDRYEDTFPGFMIMGFFVGFGVMLYIVIKRAGGTK